MLDWIKTHRPRWTTGLALAGLLGLGGFFVYDHFNDCCAEGADCLLPRLAVLRSRRARQALGRPRARLGPAPQIHALQHHAEALRERLVERAVPVDRGHDRDAEQLVAVAER